jgi:uncharacterized damage-inducible protein DinB
MTAADLLGRLLRCALRADALVLDWLESRAVSDGSLLRLQGHVLLAQRRWGLRATGFDDQEPVFADLDLPALRSLAAETGPRLMALVRDDLSRVFSHTLSNGSRASSTVADALLQVATHGHHHHAQMATRARELGFADFPDTSFVAWSRTAG